MVVLGGEGYWDRVQRVGGVLASEDPKADGPALSGSIVALSRRAYGASDFQISRILPSDFRRLKSARVEIYPTLFEKHENVRIFG